jgi:hypothetical protein
MSSHPFAECSPLQSAFYRRRDLYSLAWSHSSQDLSGYLVVSAANGGFIAVTRDPRRVVMLGKASALKPRILVYTAAGQLVESIPVSASVDCQTKSDCVRSSDTAAPSRVVGQLQPHCWYWLYLERRARCRPRRGCGSPLHASITLPRACPTRHVFTARL